MTSVSPLFTEIRLFQNFKIKEKHVQINVEDPFQFLILRFKMFKKKPFKILQAILNGKAVQNDIQNVIKNIILNSICRKRPFPFHKQSHC